MTDVFTKEKRSEVMSHIRGKGNKDTELAIIQVFKKHHITGWRRNQALFGKPDFTFRKQKIVVFVDGCFWHGCPVHATKPKNNKEFWDKKLGATKIRDIHVTQVLENKGWLVIRVWEHEFKKPDIVAERMIIALAKRSKIP